MQKNTQFVFGELKGEGRQCLLCINATIQANLTGRLYSSGPNNERLTSEFTMIFCFVGTLMVFVLRVS